MYGVDAQICLGVGALRYVFVNVHGHDHGDGSDCDDGDDAADDDDDDDDDDYDVVDDDGDAWDDTVARALLRSDDRAWDKSVGDNSSNRNLQNSRYDHSARRSQICMVSTRKFAWVLVR